MGEIFRIRVFSMFALGCLMGVALLVAAPSDRSVVFCACSEYSPYPKVEPTLFELDPILYCLSQDEKNNGRPNVAGFPAALGKARLLVIGPPEGESRPNLDLIFGDATNAEAVRIFLKSGGTLVFDSVPPNSGATAKFLTEVGVALPVLGPFPAVRKNEKLTTIPSKEGGDASHKLLSSPNPLVRELNPVVRQAYASWENAKQTAPLRLMKDPALAALVVQEGVLGAGRVIFNEMGIFSSIKTDGSLLAENLYTLAMGREVRRLPPPRLRYSATGGLGVWSKNPYAAFPLDPAAPAKMKLEKISITAAINEHASAEVLVTNPADAGPVEISVSAGGLRSPAGVGPGVTMRELVFDRPDGESPDPLPETRGFTLAPGETRILWITVNTTGSAAGEYSGELVLQPAGEEARKIPMGIRVLPISLPLGNPLRFTTWELFYGWRDKLVEDRANWKYFHQDLIDHGVNTFHVVTEFPPRKADAEGNLITGPDDFKKFRDRFQTLDKSSHYLIYGNIEMPFQIAGRKGEELKYPSPEHAKAYKAYVGAIIRFLRNLGLTYEQFSLYPYDEIRENKVEIALKDYALLKEVEPQARIFVTLGNESIDAFFEPRKGSRPIKEIAPYVDIWCPGISYYPYFANPQSKVAVQTAKVVDFCKKTGREVTSYNVTTRAPYDLCPYQRYRLKPWGAYTLGLTGYGFFGVNQWKEETFTAIYPGSRPVPSIRWEAVREGMNDVKYMMVLREKMALARKAGKDVSKAEELLAGALKEVNEKSLDASLAPTYREKVANMILEMQGAELR